MDVIIPSEAEGDDLWKRNCEYVPKWEWDKLDAENKRLRAVLARISTADYRGNRPSLSQMAYEALHWRASK